MPVIGTQQSPIRIENAKAIRVPNSYADLSFNYQDDLPGRFNKDNFVFDFAKPPCEETDSDTDGKILMFGTEEWVIRKIHIHKPAEHTFEEDDPLPYECHLLHSRQGDVKARGPKLVVATFFAVPTKDRRPTSKQRSAMRNVDRSTLLRLNQELASYKSGGDTNCSLPYATPVNPLHFLPSESHRNRWYRYEGSLTSDPFTEDVTWFLLPDESFIEESEISEIGDCAEQEARPVHSLDRRFILKNF